MSGFAIVIGDEAAGSASCGDGEATGRIVLGAFVEGFCCSLSFWSEADYRRQWRHALTRIVEQDGSRSALVTNALDPDDAGVMVWWPIYREGSTVRLANGLVPDELYDLRQVLDDPAAAVPTAETLWVDEGEGRPSEWVVDVADVVAFLADPPTQER